MTFQTETVLFCSVPPSSRDFERLNTEKPPDRQRDPCRSPAVSIGVHALGHQPVGVWIRMDRLVSETIKPGSCPASRATLNDAKWRALGWPARTRLASSGNGAYRRPVRRPASTWRVLRDRAILPKPARSLSGSGGLT
jgi:hypothetical protein